MEVALTCRARPVLDHFPTEQGVRCQDSPVRGPKSGVRSRKASAAGTPILTPGSLLLTPALQEMKVHPEMLMKTKDRVRSPKSKGFCGWYADSDSWLLTPDSCSSRNEGASGDVDENKGTRTEWEGKRPDTAPGSNKGFTTEAQSPRRELLPDSSLCCSVSSVVNLVSRRCRRTLPLEPTMCKKINTLSRENDRMSWALSC